MPLSQHLSYDNRLEELGLMCLSDRRVRSDLIETFKIASDKYDVRKEDCYEFDKGGSRGHCKKLFKKWCRLDVRKYTFSNRVVDSGILSLIVVLTALLFIRLRCTLPNNW